MHHATWDKDPCNILSGHMSYMHSALQSDLISFGVCVYGFVYVLRHCFLVWGGRRHWTIDNIIQQPASSPDQNKCIIWRNKEAPHAINPRKLPTSSILFWHKESWQAATDTAAATNKKHSLWTTTKTTTGIIMPVPACQFNEFAPLYCILKAHKEAAAQNSATFGSFFMCSHIRAGLTPS